MRNNPQALSPDQRETLLDWLASSDTGLSVTPGYQASVHVYRGPAGTFVIKEPSGWGLRKTLNRAAIRREERVYRRLQGISGIPRCYGRIDDRYLVLEHVPGGTLHALEDELSDRGKFYARLLETLLSMHDARVAHGDLKRKRNILVGPGEQPFVIDFGIAVTVDGQRGFLYDLARQVDRNAWIKHKYRGQIGNISHDDAALYRPMRSERLARALRIAWNAATLRKWRKRRRKSRDACASGG